METIGRPPWEYDSKIGDRICEGLRSGLSLRKIVAAADMPSLTTVFKWMQKNPEFAELYTRAREDQAETLADDILNIADDESIEPEHKRIMVDSRKWIASKLKPKKYGDRQIVDQNVTVSLVDLVTASMKTVEHLPVTSAPAVLPAPASTPDASLITVDKPSD